IMSFIAFTAVDYSPLVWLGVIGAIVATNLPVETRAILVFLFVVQCSIIYWFLPHEVRYLGGFHFGLVIVFALFVAPTVLTRLASTRWMTIASICFLLPWLAVQTYYAKQFLPVSFGREKAAFYERYLAFYVDYRRLHRILSRDTVVLVTDF